MSDGTYRRPYSSLHYSKANKADRTPPEEQGKSPDFSAGLSRACHLARSLRGVLLLAHHFPGFVGDFLGHVLHFAARLIDFSFAFQVLVVRQFADSLLNAALGLVYLTCHDISFPN